VEVYSGRHVVDIDFQPLGLKSDRKEGGGGGGHPPTTWGQGQCQEMDIFFNIFTESQGASCKHF
jgi:hypothetical protein